MAYHRERKILSGWIASGAKVTWDVPHARRQAKARCVAVFVAERIIRNGAVVQVGTEVGGVERWRLTGHDPDGRPIAVVVEPGDEVIRVITVIRTDE